MSKIELYAYEKDGQSLLDQLVFRMVVPRFPGNGREYCSSDFRPLRCFRTGKKSNSESVTASLRRKLNVENYIFRVTDSAV